MECSSQRRSSIVCAMKELYCDMASVSAICEDAAAGVVTDDKNDVRVLDSELGYNNEDRDLNDQPFQSPKQAFKPPTYALSI